MTEVFPVPPRPTPRVLDCYSLAGDTGLFSPSSCRRGQSGSVLPPGGEGDSGFLPLRAAAAGRVAVPARPPCRPHGGAHTRCARTRRTRPGTDAHIRHSKLCTSTRSTYCERSKCHTLCGALQQEPAHSSCCPQGAGGRKPGSPQRGQCPASGTLSLSAGGVWAGSNFRVSHLTERPKVEGREESFVPEAEKGFLEMNSGRGRVKWTVQL